MTVIIGTSFYSKDIIFNTNLSLSDKKATSETKTLYKNLYILSQKGFLFGHQDDLAYGVKWKYEDGRSDIKDVVGDYPAVYGWDIAGLEKDDKNNIDGVPFAKMKQYIIDGSAKRLRPKLMTVSVSLFGLIPILWATGTGSDIMLPITVPLIGGTITSTIYVLLVTPIVFEMVKLRELRTKGKIELIDVKE